MTNGKQQQKETAPCQSLAVFDKEEIVRGNKLGSGGFCHVFEAKSFHPSPQKDLELSESQVEARAALAANTTKRKHTEPPYAVKMIQPKLTSNPTKFLMAASDMESEAKVLSLVNHRNIIKLHGVAFESSEEKTTDGQQLLILDRLDETLNDRLCKWKVKAKRLNKPLHARFLDRNGIKRNKFLIERLQVASEIASALEYLHEMRIVYRDLKPSNCGFDSNGRVRLFDFGLARTLPEETEEFDDTYEMSGKVGTFRFMPPEVAMRKPYNEKADVYSFSLTLYYILALEKPYEYLSKQDHKEKIVKGGERPPIDSQWPREIQILLHKAWSPKIAARPSMTEVLATLNDVICDLMGEKPQVPDATTVFTVETQSLMKQPVKSFETVATVPSLSAIWFGDLKATPCTRTVRINASVTCTISSP